MTHEAHLIECRIVDGNRSRFFTPMTFDKLEICVRSQIRGKSLLPQFLILTTTEADAISDDGDLYAFLWSKWKASHNIKWNISSNIYAISAKANPFEYTEPQV